MQRGLGFTNSHFLVATFERLGVTLMHHFHTNFTAANILLCGFSTSARPQMHATISKNQPGPRVLLHSIRMCIYLDCSALQVVQVLDCWLVWTARLLYTHGS